MTTVYDYDQTLALLQRAVAEKGEDYSPRGCFYYDEMREPKCIVGHVLSYIDTDGAIRDAIMSGKWSEGVPLTNNTRISMVAPLLKSKGVEFTPRALRLMDYTQINQDCSMPWGGALMCAIEDTKGADA